jgi:hypothetical protein
MDTKKLFGTIIGVTLFGVLIAGATFAWLTFGDVTIGNNVLTANTVNFVVNYENGGAVTDLPILDSVHITADKPAVISLVLKKNVDNPANPDGHASIWLNTTSTTKLTRDGVVRWAICRDPDVETGDDLVNGKQVDDVCGDAAQVIMNADKPDYDGNTSSPVLNSGIITATGKIPLLSDAKLADAPTTRGSGLVASCSTSSDLSMCEGTQTNTHLLEADGVSYFVYMWLEAEPLVNDHLKEQYYKPGTQTQYKLGVDDVDNNSDGKPDLDPDYESGIKFDLYSGYVYASATQLQN